MSLTIRPAACPVANRLICANQGNMVLLVAMIGAIVLTLRQGTKAKRQDIAAQVARSPAKGLKIVSIKPGEGIAP